MQRGGLLQYLHHVWSGLCYGGILGWPRLSLRIDAPGLRAKSDVSVHGCVQRRVSMLAAEFDESILHLPDLLMRVAIEPLPPSVTFIDRIRR